jgi:CMP-N,N'-diacetyllegionaminic acid synthase
LPGKNKKIFSGKPLIQWSIEQAAATKLFDRIVVSSDDKDILQIAKDFKKLKVVPTERHPELAGDNADMDAVLYDFFFRKENKCKYICLLPPTSPLRSPDDIKKMFKYVQMEKYWTVISVKWCDFIGWVEKPTNRGPLPTYNINQRPNRQTRNDFFLENGSIYWFKHEIFIPYGHMIANPEKTKLYEMPAERSLEIDTPLDFYIAEKVYEYQNKQPCYPTGCDNCNRKCLYNVNKKYKVGIDEHMKILDKIKKTHEWGKQDK